MAQLYNELSSNIQTTTVLDVSQIKEMDISSIAFKELIIRLAQQANSHAMATNIREIGLYDTQEQLGVQAFFPTPTVGGASSGNITPTNRAVYRKVINFGALPGSSATISVPHGITIALLSSFTVTRIYGASTKMTNNLATMSFIPLPYSDPNAAANSIALYLDGTNVNITTGTKNWSAWTQTYIVMEFMKN